MTIGPCLPQPLPYSVSQRAALAQPRAGIPSGDSARMRYAPVDGATASCRIAVSPDRIRNLLNARPQPTPARPPVGRTLYVEQDCRRDLTRLIGAKDDLERYVGFHRTRLGKGRLLEMSRISTKIEALKDRITHADPCAPETQKFQREANALQSLVRNQLDTPVAKQYRPKQQQASRPAAGSHAGKSGDAGPAGDQSPVDSPKSILKSPESVATGDKKVVWQDNDAAQRALYATGAIPKHDVSIPLSWRRGAPEQEAAPEPISPNWHAKPKGSHMRRLWATRTPSFSRSLPIVPDAVRAATQERPDWAADSRTGNTGNTRNP